MLAGKCALITGSTTGLGYAIAKALAAHGCNIVLNGIVYSSEETKAQEKLAQSSGAGVIYVKADIADPAQIEQLVASAASGFGSIDIVVNNAVVRHFASIEKLTPAEWDQSLAVNLSAPFHITRLVLPMMRARGWGRIFNLSSYYGFRGAENRIGYVTTKTALIGMTRAIALKQVTWTSPATRYVPAHCRLQISWRASANSPPRRTSARRKQRGSISLGGGLLAAS